MARNPVRILMLILLAAFVTADARAGASSDSGPPSMPFPTLAGESPYNGIDAAAVDGFWMKWRLVTTRYRTDNQEQRFIWANDIAWIAILEGRKEYPDGAMFGKVAFQTKGDPEFPVSLSPGKVTRIQLMKKDRARYPDSSGWGFAIYPAKNRGDDPERHVVKACWACHDLVKNRDYVFAEPAFARSASDSAKLPDFGSRFKKTATASLGTLGKEALAKLTLKQYSSVKVLKMNIFGGSLAELFEPVVGVAGKDTVPYLVLDETADQYLAAEGLPPNSSCKTAVRFALRRTVKPPYVLKNPQAFETPSYNSGTACESRVISLDN